ncbi:MAG: serine hydrolase [Chitinophagaceae bacterium]|nr:serine hydrolase [Chitinophagaceae bacterium]
MFIKKTRTLLITAFFFFACACTVTKTTPVVENNPMNSGPEIRPDTPVNYGFLERLFRQHPGYFDSILKYRKDWNVQVLYTRVDRKRNGQPELEEQGFNVNPSAYFYPASTVKFPIVLLALQRLNELKDKGIDMNTTMVTEAAFSGQTPVYNDPTTPDGRPTIAQYIKKILLVSDNDAFNRLYEFLGQEYIHTELQKKGYPNVQIRHRLNIFLSQEQNSITNPVRFLDSNNRIIHEEKLKRSQFRFSARNDSLGRGYMKGGVLVRGAMDFSSKNRISLPDLHQMLISLVFPEKVKPSQRFNITESDKQFVLKYMSQYPTESVYPPYSADTLNYWPAYCKFMLFGAGKEPLPEQVRVFSKSGDAYGHVLDVAYVVDFKNQVEFFVSAVMYCNSDGILNDDRYDYQSIGFPFMKQLGQVLLDHEIKRERKFKPDLEPFKFKYDK